jgi:T5SS/PEP-CTERM-associated repeat protein
LSTAAIITSGDIISPVYDSNDPWFIHLDPNDDLTIGDTAAGSMEISLGSWVQNTDGYIGRNPTASGTVTITGEGMFFGSRWWNNDYLYVGYSGTGVLDILAGGHVRSIDGIIGMMPDSSGSVTVSGSGAQFTSLFESDNIYVGYEGDGELLVSDGGNVVTSLSSFIGYQPGSVGTVTVTGTDSLWQTTGGLYVGGGEDVAGGMGLLNIGTGGTVEAGSVRIWPTGTLIGEGRLVSGSVSNAGTIKPGSSIGTLTIEGNLTMQPDSTYEVEIDNSGNSDLLSVTGNLAINGGTVKAVSTETVTGTKQYTIINAGNITGAFDAEDTALVDSTILLSDDVSFDYRTDTVLMQIQVRPFDDPSFIQNDNQLAVARAFQQIDNGGDNPITTALQNLDSISQVRNAYDQLCGQTRLHLAPVTAVDTGKFMNTVADRLNYAIQGLSYYEPYNGPLLAMASPDKSDAYSRMYYTTPYFSTERRSRDTGYQDYEEWVFWGKGYGVFGDRKTESEVPGYDYNIYGTSFGLDSQASDNALMGLTAGYSMSFVDSDVAGDESNIKNAHVGIYGSHYANYLHIDSIVTYSFLKYETERKIYLLNEKITGDSDGHGISGYVEARYDWGNINHWVLQPLAAFQFSLLSLDGYNEDGGASSLEYDNQSYSSYKGSLGAKLTQELFNRDRSYRESIQLRGRWIHEFGDNNSSMEAHFVSDPDVVFKVSDQDIARDSALLGISFNADIDNYTRLSLGYDAYLNSDGNMHLVSAMFVYRW